MLWQLPAARRSTLCSQWVRPRSNRQEGLQRSLRNPQPPLQPLGELLDGILIPRDPWNCLKDVPYLCQPVSAIPSRTSGGLLLATCSHWRWFFKWCPMSVRDWLAPVAPLKALANHTFEKPHLRYFSMRCTAIRHKRTFQEKFFSLFRLECNVPVKRNPGPVTTGCWALYLKSGALARRGDLTPSSSNLFWCLPSCFHTPSYCSLFPWTATSLQC